MFEREQAAPSFDVTGWVFRIAAAAVFILVGLAKLRAGSIWARIFDQIGWGDWLRNLAATMQITGGVLFLIPRTVLAGAFLTGCTMAGAIFAHFYWLGTGFGGAVFPLALLVFIVVVAVRTKGPRH